MTVRRMGSVLLIVLVALVVAGAVAAELVRTVVIRESAARGLHHRRQAQLLAESALERSLLRRRASSDYAGETWRPLESLQAQIEIAGNVVTVVARVGQGPRSAAYRLEHPLGPGENP